MNSKPQNSPKSSPETDFNKLAVENAIVGNEGPMESSNGLDAYSPYPDLESGLDSNSNSKDFAALPTSKEPSNDGFPLKRRQSSFSRVATRLGFFDTSLTEYRIKLVGKFFMVYLIMALCILGIFSIYWGSMYKRNDRYSNLKVLVVVEDSSVDGIEPLVGNAIRDLANSEEARKLAGFHVKNYTEILKEVQGHKEVSVEQEIARVIHHQLYWSSIYIKQNTTYKLFQALQSADSSFNLTLNGPQSLYETGRDFQSMNSYVKPNIESFERLFLSLQASLINTPLIQKLTTAEVENLVTGNATDLLSSPLIFNYIDNKPYKDPVLLAPSQVGLIYMIILTFFQFNFFISIHMEVGQLGLKSKHYILYRVLASFLSYFVLSLVYCWVSLAFQVNMQIAFGKSGFLVLWSISFLTMSALGVYNEIMALICFATYPPIVGFWMLFWVIINISPTFTPMALTAKFYRYGYAVPVHNSYEATKVVFFDTYKGQFGRNIGILLAWIVIGNIILPFVLIFSGKKVAAKKKSEIDQIIANHEKK